MAVCQQRLGGWAGEVEVERGADLHRKRIERNGGRPSLPARAGVGGTRCRRRKWGKALCFSLPSLRPSRARHSSPEAARWQEQRQGRRKE